MELISIILFINIIIGTEPSHLTYHGQEAFEKTHNTHLKRQWLVHVNSSCSETFFSLVIYSHPFRENIIYSNRLHFFHFS